MSAYALLKSLFLLTFFIVSLRASAQLQDPTYVGHVCTNRISRNSTYFKNLEVLLSSLSSNNAYFSLGSHSLTKGQNPDMVFGLYLCRGDLSPEFCRECIIFAATESGSRCPGGKEFLIQYDECMLGYSDRNFMETVTTATIITWNTQNVTPDQSVRFNGAVASLMKKSAEEAANSNSSKKFAVGKSEFTSSMSLYALVQCNIDLSSEDCLSCLQKSIQKLYFNKLGGRFLVPSCNSRYETYPFYNETLEGTVLPPPDTAPLLPPVSAPPLPPGKGEKSTVITIAIVVPVAISVLLFVAVFSFYVRKRKKKPYDTGAANDERDDDITTAGSLQFDLKVIEAATDKFSIFNKLGQGGFGQVYKGILPNGVQVAVKRLSKTSGQGEKEFKNEVVVVAKLQHRNLVKLLGFCLEREEKILVYEFVPNKSLDYFYSNMQTQLDWTTRYKIIGGIARGILYLHQDSRLTIIHRDLKAGNILLDADMNPKVADFGMARIFEMDQTEDNTRRIVGTYGYMSPEYAMYGQFSMKSDVYSFGVLVLEIISGRKNSSLYQMDTSFGNLVTYTWRLWSNGSPLELVDSSFRENFQRDEIIRCIHIALLCVQEDNENRPTMSAISIALAVPKAPGFFFRSNHEQAGPSKDKSSLFSIDAASITTVVPR
ncbi:hypothetical protein CARUB_v10004324mg [Capsella rubella]|uniref:Uncharacterized protein n=1 Tax=Capsella rubella TaxID=81985 RepID=R0F2D1_9BRAS|nr:hypothetical protein CARUB_v10004324mg [Capsella rubella]